MFFRLVVFFIFSFLSLPQLVVAQLEPDSRINHYSIRDGLSQNVVNSITQDKQGLMWFATEDGLSRFDGYSFKIFKYDPDNGTGLADNFVQRVLTDEEGVLWVSSRKGLQQFDQLKEQFTLYRHPLLPGSSGPNNDVSFMDEAGADNLWVAWYGAGFASFNRNAKTFVPYTDETLQTLTSTQTLTLHEDAFGLLWVGTQNGGLQVFKVSQGRVVEKHESLSVPTALPTLSVRCLSEDHEGNMWIGTAHGLVLYKRSENRFYTLDGDHCRVAGKSIFTLLADSHETLWIGVQGGGLYSLDLRQISSRPLDDIIFNHVTNLDDYDISKRTILSLYEDKDKNLWIGTYGDGFYMISNVKEKFHKIQTQQYSRGALSYVQYYGICYDQAGNLWLGTDGDGIYRSEINGKVIKHYQVGQTPGLTDHAIISALCDHHNNLWFGSYSQGVFKYDRKTDSFINYHYAGDRSLAGADDVRVLFEDSHHQIWVGTNRGGLCLLDEATRSYKNLPGTGGVLHEGDIRAIVEEDSTGRLWIGCYGDGLHTFTPGTKANHSTRYFHQSEEDDQLKSNVVLTLCKDRNGNLWIGTGGGGLSRYHFASKKLTRYSSKDGLANSTIYAALADNAGNIWVSTNKGISKYDVTQNHFYNYDVNDGLQEGQYNPGSAMYNDIAGFMCFGGTMALNIFYPEQVVETLKKPRVMISGFRLFNKTVEVGSEDDNDAVLTNVISQTRHITLRHDQSVITFEFVGINYSYPEKNRYAYKLEGLDRDWNYVGKQRSATYRYLEPGSYVFKVKASNQEDVWNDDYESVAITILSPFWKTPLAYLIYGLVLGALCVAALTIRKRQLLLSKRLSLEKAQRKREQQLVQEKLSFFTEISHEFRTPLTLMIGPLEEMLHQENGNTPNGRKLNMVYRNAYKLLALINKLLDYRKVESGNIVLKVMEDDLVAFTEDIFITFKELAERKNIRFSFVPHVATLMVWFDKEKLEMVLNNIIANSFKYIGQGNEIRIEVRPRPAGQGTTGEAEVQISDNGIGIPKRQMKNIFDWFYKGKDSGPMSSGIGLALAQKLVHLHKGEISVESEEGRGATFRVKIPLGKDHFKADEIVVDIHEEKLLIDEKGDVAIPTATEDEDTTGRKGLSSLLIVEDEDEIRSFLREYLAPHFKILEARHGKEGLAVAHDHYIDLVISDVMMPEMDGIDFCKELKNNIRTSHIPVILLTAKTQLTHHKEGIETGADAYITKPFSPEMLTLTINNLLQSRENVKRYYRNLFTSTAPVAEEATPSPDKEFLRAIYDVLKANINHTGFSIDDLCDALAMSRPLLYKKVKMLTGLSPVEYLRSLRMQEAAVLLKSGKYKVFEVVYMVGFSDLKYFRQCFVKEFGSAPSKFLPRP